MDCLDLKDRFRRRYKVVSEDGNPRNSDPWLWTIPCRRGHIYPHGGERLGAATDTRHGVFLRRLLAIPSARLEQLGDDGANVSFHLADLKAVAAIMAPRRRRQLTPEQKTRLAGMGRKFQPKHAVHVTKTEPESTAA